MEIVLPKDQGPQEENYIAYLRIIRYNEEKGEPYFRIVGLDPESTIYVDMKEGDLFGDITYRDPNVPFLETTNYTDIVYPYKLRSGE